MVATKRGSTNAIKLRERLTDGPLTLGNMLEAVREEPEELTLDVFAKRLGMRRQSLCDIEKVATA